MFGMERILDRVITTNYVIPWIVLLSRPSIWDGETDPDMLEMLRLSKAMGGYYDFFGNGGTISDEILKDVATNGGSFLAQSMQSDASCRSFCKCRTRFFL